MGQTERPAMVEADKFSALTCMCVTTPVSSAIKIVTALVECTQANFADAIRHRRVQNQPVQPSPDLVISKQIFTRLSSEVQLNQLRDRYV